MAPRKFLVLFLLLAVFCAAFWVRVRGTELRGIAFYDEAFYLLEAKTFAKVPSLAVGLVKERPTDGASARNLIHRYFPEGFFPTTTGRPGYVLTLAPFMLFDGGTGFPALIFSALAGAMAVCAVFLLVFELTEAWLAALAAAAVIAFSPYHVLYSRIAYPHVFAALLVTFAAYAYCRSFRSDRRTVFRWLFLTGVLAGYALSVHVNVAPIILAWVAFECAIIALRYRADVYGRLGVLASGFFLPLLFWQLLLVAKGRVMLALGSAGQAGGYVSEFIDIMRGNAGGNHLALGNAAFYLHMFEYLDGRFVALCIAIALISYFIVRGRQDPRYVFLLWMVAAFSLFYSLTALRATRTYVVVVPMLYACAVIGLWYLVRLAPSRTFRNAVMSAVPVILLFAHLPMLRTILSLESGYARATAAFLDMSREEMRIGVPWPVFQWHAQDRVHADEDVPAADAERFWRIADWSGAIEHPGENRFENGHRPVVTFPNPLMGFYPFLGDLLYNKSEDEMPSLVITEPRLTSIRIYAPLSGE